MTAKIWNLNDWITECDPAVLTATFDAMIREAGFTVLQEVEHYFQPQGYTKLYLLCESHFAIHTFPEENKTYIELSSCNKAMQFKFVKLFTQYKNGGQANGKSGKAEKGN